MAQAIEFYFDFSSPYSYIASQRIEALAAKYHRAVAFRPILLGAAFKAAGTQPLTLVPLKGDYSMHDFARTARFHDLQYKHPTPFPISTVNTARAVLVLQQQGSAKTAAFVRRAFKAHFVEGQAINEPEVIGALAGELGIDPAPLLEGIQDPAIKAKLKADTDAAIARGIFGAPFFYVDGEPFWGQDRFDQMERWLKHGPF